MRQESAHGAHATRFEFGSLPRDPDRDAALVEVRDPEHQRDQIVLSTDLTRKLDRTIAEYRNRGALAKHGLGPRSQLLSGGPPGRGKTLAAEVLAAELALPQIYAAPKHRGSRPPEGDGAGVGCPQTLREPSRPARDPGSPGGRRRGGADRAPTGHQSRPTIA